MKKSDITVSMPMTAYNDLENYVERYTCLVKELSDCFNSQLYDAGASQSIDFNAQKALEICKRFIPYKLEGLDIEIKV